MARITNDFPVELMDEAQDTWNTECIWGDVTTKQAKTRWGLGWSLTYNGIKLGTISVEADGSYTAVSESAAKGVQARSCESPADGEIFIVMAYTGDWREVANLTYASPIK